MRKVSWAIVLFSASLVVAQAPPTPLPPSAPNPQQASSKDLKQAKKEFEAGIKLKKEGNLTFALEHFEKASQLQPANADYAMARELTRQALVTQAIERGNSALRRNATIEAQAEFAQALQLDPNNRFAAERARSLLSPLAEPSIRYEDAAPPIELAPKEGKHAFEYRGDARNLLTNVGKAYGITVMFDDSVQAKRVRFDMGEADFITAMSTACAVTKTFWVPMSRTQVMTFANTPANRRDFQRMVARTFYFRDATTASDLNDLVNVFRVIFDVRFVVAQPANSSITVRAPQPMLAAMTRFFEALDAARPQVALHVRIYQISHTYSRTFGTGIPLQFTTFNIGTLLNSLGSSNIQQLIDQLTKSGALNGSNGQGLDALLGQFLQGQNSQLASLLSNPFATYGGGLTLMALIIPPSQLKLALNEADIRLVDELTVRASQGNAATIQIGSRYPIETSSYSSAFGGGLLSQFTGNSQFAAYPSFSYEDLGITFKATPAIFDDQDVRLNMELKVRSIAGFGVNNIPILGNREYTSVLTLKNGETGVVAGMLERSESRAISGLPLLGNVPGLAPAFRTEDKERSESEILVVITPTIQSIRSPYQEVIPMERSGS